LRARRESWSPLRLLRSPTPTHFALQPTVAGFPAARSPARDLCILQQDRREVLIERHGLGGAEQSEYMGPGENAAFLQPELCGECRCTFFNERGWMFGRPRSNVEGALPDCAPGIDCDESARPCIEHVPEAEVCVQIRARTRRGTQR